MNGVIDSIGQQLRKAREHRHLDIPDVAHKTKIPAHFLRDLEEDEYSNFPSLTYARYFLGIYSRFVEVDTTEFQREFTVPNLGSIEEYTYLQEPTETLRGSTPEEPEQRAAKEQKERIPIATGSQKSLPLFLAALAGILILTVTIVAANRGGSKDEVKAEASKDETLPPETAPTSTPSTGSQASTPPKPSPESLVAALPAPPIPEPPEETPPVAPAIPLTTEENEFESLNSIPRAIPVD